MQNEKLVLDILPYKKRKTIRLELYTNEMATS